MVTNKYKLIRINFNFLFTKMIVTIAAQYKDKHVDIKIKTITYFLNGKRDQLGFRSG
jgi:hypothetical protein